MIADSFIKLMRRSNGDQRTSEIQPILSIPAQRRGEIEFRIFKRRLRTEQRPSSTKRCSRLAAYVEAGTFCEPVGKKELAR
jgi:hypothetical protein